MSNFLIDGTGIKNPSSFKIERYNITSLERLADATMVGDLIAKKLKFYFTYSVIEAAALDEILDLIWNTNELFYTLTYPYNGETKTAKVYVGSIPTELYKATNDSHWVWTNVTFDLIEQ